MDISHNGHNYAHVQDPASLSCTDSLNIIYTALCSRTVQFNTTVTQYRLVFDELLPNCTSIPDAEACGIECLVLVEKIETLLKEQKALLDSLDSAALANLLVQSAQGKAMGFDEQAARDFVGTQLAGFWEDYLDAEDLSCVEQRRGYVKCEVKFVVEKLKDRKWTVYSKRDRNERRNTKR